MSILAHNTKLRISGIYKTKKSNDDICIFTPSIYSTHVIFTDVLVFSVKVIHT